MSSHKNRSTRAGRAASLGSVTVAVLGATSLALSGPAGAAAAASGAPQITNRETVEVRLDSTGKVDHARVIDQLVVEGKGKVEVVNPISTKGLRNLDGFGTPTTRNGAAVYNVDVDGRETRRLTSDFTKKLPLTVEVFYKLDGVRVDPEDVVGEDGDLEVTYTVRNVTAEPTEISYQNGKGEAKTATVDLVTPFVGILEVTLPERFTDIESPRADVAGDGRGGTLLQWTMVLFEPIGEITQSFGYSTRIRDGIIPEAHMQAVPVPPQRKPELKFGQEGFKSGVKTATTLTGGVSKIDANLIKLRDGVGELLDGLGQLAAGANELQAGLADKAAPGAIALSEGLGQAKAGGDQLNVGAGKLAAGLDAAAAGGGKLAGGLGQLDDGAGKLAAGSQQLLKGSQDLAAGAGLVNGGAQELASKLPAAVAGAKQLRAGVGTATDQKTILGGLTALAAGLPTAKAGVDQIQAGLAAAVAAGGSSDQLIAAQRGVALALCGTATPPPLTAAPTTPCGFATAVLYGLQASKASLTTAAGGLAQVSAGLATAVGAATALRDGVGGQLAPGLDQLIVGLEAAAAGAKQLAAGTSQVAEGAGKLSAEGALPIAEGLSQLKAGTSEASKGAGDLFSGLGQLDAGGAQLAAGTAKLNGGLGQLYDGSQELATGLEDAAEGSGKLADGMNQAASGGQQIFDGATLLQRVGTSLIVDAANKSAGDYSLEYATMLALNKKAEAGALPYGAPEGAIASAAYDYRLSAVTGESGGNVGRGAGALALLALGSGAAFLVRRRFTA